MRSSSSATVLILGAVLVAGALPIFADVYRISLFGAVSYDDYAPYLLWLLGEPGGRTAPSPHFYRIGSVALAAPFYYLPPIGFSGIDETVAYQKATQAMCLANVFYLSLAALTVSAYLRLRLAVSAEWSFVAAFVFLLLSRYLGLNGVDGIATLPLTLLVFTAAERRVAHFAVLLIIGAAINEKIIITSALFVFLRTLFVPEARREYFLMSLANAAVLAVYIFAVAALAVAGNENHVDPSTYFGGLLDMVHRSLSARGFYLNAWAPLLLTGMWAVAMQAPRSRAFTLACDLGVILLLLLIAFALDVNLNAGRIVMYSMPIFLTGSVQALASMQHGRDRLETGSSGSGSMGRGENAG